MTTSDKWSALEGKHHSTKHYTNSTWHASWLAMAARCGGSELPQPPTKILHLRMWSFPHWHRYCTCTLWWRCHNYYMYQTSSCMHTYVYTCMHTKQPCPCIMGIAQGSTHTTHIQYRELQTADITQIIRNPGWCQLFQATWPLSVQRTLSQSHFSVSSHTLHTAITHVLNILKLQNSSGN